MQTETYNGWKNYPTWCVNLWISNEEPLYREALERTANVLKDVEESGPGDVWTEGEAKLYRTADMLKDWVEEMAEDAVDKYDAGFATGLLGYALGCVDWEEIADAWIENVCCPPLDRAHLKD